MLKSIAVDGIPVGVSSHAEVAAARLTTAVAEKTARIACHLVPRNGNVLEDLLLDDVVVGIEGREPLD